MNLQDRNDLMEALQRGDTKAFASIFDLYHAYLYALAFRYLRSQDDAEDVVQHAFMRFWELRETFSYANNVKNLLFTIAKNHILNQIRHRTLIEEKHKEIMGDSIDSENELFDGIADADFKVHLRGEIDRLPPQKRDVCIYKIMRNMSNQEVADLMGISVPTVKSHYTQAIKLLRRSIEKFFVLTTIGSYL